LIDREHDVIGASTTPIVNLLDPAAERRARAHAIVHQATALANVCFSGRLDRSFARQFPSVDDGACVASFISPDKPRW
jgi:hypothetical protein